MKTCYILLFLMLAMSITSGCNAVKLVDDLSEKASASGQKQVVSDKIEKKLEDMQGIIYENFYFDTEDEQTQEYIYKGMMQSLQDPYSVYYTADEYKSLQESNSGEYVGIGVQVQQDADTGFISIVRVFDGPAKEAGILKGDIITEVDGEDIRDKEVNEVIKGIKGKEGTKVTVTMYRKDEKRYIDFEMKRKKVENPTVTYEMLDEQIGYISVTEFYEVTAQQFRLAVENLKVQGMKGLVVDLRDNGGGLLDIAVDMLDFMLPEGKIVYTEDKYGNITSEYNSTNDEQFTLPLAVLVNENSASASEIFAGAIKDHGIGKIIGTTTYGKGIVQRLFPLGDGSALKLTISKYFTPNGNDIHKIGIEPDIEVELDEGLKTKSDIEKGEDNQLQAAIRAIQ